MMIMIIMIMIIIISRFTIYNISCIFRYLEK